MKHLVTGGSGFLGNLVALRLLERGEKVRVLDLWEDPSRPRDIEFVRCDIRDRDGVARALQGVDVVHHNVALVPLTKSGSKFREVNVEGSRLAAEESVKAGVQAFIHMSSSAVYGLPDRCPIDGSTPYRPIEIYGKGKWEGELAVREVLEKAGVPLVVIRPRTILGPGRLGIFKILFDWIREGRKVYVIGDGRQLFQFLHAHDLIDFYQLALDSGKAGVYNVGAERFGTLREALENLIAYAGTSSRVAGLPAGLTIGALGVLDRLGLSPLAPWHYKTYHKPFHFDVAPLLRMGWKPRYSNDEMLRESYDWYRSHLDSPGIGQGPGAVHRRPVREMILKLLKWVS